ncbi:hypothetical protein [Pseudomonas fluorescens]|uniref:hypothetical protein n=1 Tax=Pseudomonas fluorescens TaxID=294 RepID=UPI001BE55386|nr:hypothetical protein [Pseudomonas fluorescens]MBT2375759.1 hypothetical protein [Pseudomonas fluorescens]
MKINGKVEIKVVTDAVCDVPTQVPLKEPWFSACHAASILGYGSKHDGERYDDAAR